MLVTHRTNILDQTDFLCVLKEGLVTEFGPPNKIIGDDGSEISLYMEEIGQRKKKEEEELKAEEEKAKAIEEKKKKEEG